VAVGLGVAVIGGTGAAGLTKPGIAVLVVVVEGSGFVAGVGKVVVAGLAKKFGTVGGAGTGRMVEGVGTDVGVANRFLAGSLVSVTVVAPVVGFDCAEVAGVGVDKLGVVVLLVEMVVAGARVREGFLISTTFFVSWSFCLIFDIASASISCFSHFENDLTCFNRGESKPTAAGL
jgi:hypothetical protein